MRLMHHVAVVRVMVAAAVVPVLAARGWWVRVVLLVLMAAWGMVERCRSGRGVWLIFLRDPIGRLQRHHCGRVRLLLLLVGVERGRSAAVHIGDLGHGRDMIRLRRLHVARCCCRGGSLGSLCFFAFTRWQAFLWSCCARTATVTGCTARCALPDLRRGIELLLLMVLFLRLRIRRAGSLCGCGHGGRSGGRELMRADG